MFPMITSRELQMPEAILQESPGAAGRGQKGGRENIEVGTMIETPAAVLIADDLAARYNSIPIGTDDLTQYTCALDRKRRAGAVLQPPSPGCAA